jgi:hypothetical protein
MRLSLEESWIHRSGRRGGGIGHGGDGFDIRARTVMERDCWVDQASIANSMSSRCLTPQLWLYDFWFHLTYQALESSTSGACLRSRAMMSHSPISPQQSRCDMCIYHGNLASSMIATKYRDVRGRFAITGYEQKSHCLMFRKPQGMKVDCHATYSMIWKEQHPLYPERNEVVWRLK